jgi:hypothetical protein
VVFYGYIAGGLFIFYTGNWEEYHCEVMRTNMHGFGVTELHWIIIAFFIINGLSNNLLSNITIGELGISNKEYGDSRLITVLWMIGNISTLMGISGNLITVFASKKHSLLHQLSGLLPLVMVSAYFTSAFMYTE